MVIQLLHTLLTTFSSSIVAVWLFHILRFPLYQFVRSPWLQILINAYLCPQLHHSGNKVHWDTMYCASDNAKGVATLTPKQHQKRAAECRECSAGACNWSPSLFQLGQYVHAWAEKILHHWALLMANLVLTRSRAPTSVCVWLLIVQICDCSLA